DTGFRDINMKMRLPNGHVAEFRIEHRGLLEAAHHTHDPYEKVQDIERRASLENRPLTPDEMFDRQKLMDEVRDIHAHAANPAGLDSLLNDQGRAKLATHAQERLPVIDPGKIPESANFMSDIGKRAGILGGIAMGGLAAGITLA